MEGHVGFYSKYLGRDSISEIEPLLREIESPFALGLQLCIPTDILKDIERKHHNDNRRQIIEVIDYWLKNNTECAWGALAEAVKRVGGHKNLVRKLKQKDSEPVVESMEMECSANSTEPMMVRVPIQFDRAVVTSSSNGTRQPKKRIGVTQSCPNFVVSGGEIFSVNSDTDKVRSSSVSNAGASMRVTLNESDFDNDIYYSSPPTSSPTEMETDANSGTSTPPQYKTVDAPTLRAKRVQRRDNMLKIIEELKSDPNAKEFINFIDKKRDPDYDEKTDYPMCLNEITARINRNQCDTREKFCDEFYAIIENCETYYGSESEQAIKARKLNARFDELVEQHVPDDSKLLNWKGVTKVVPSKPRYEYHAVDAPTPRGKRLQIKYNMLTSGEMFSVSSDTDKLRSSSVSDTGASMRVTLNESDFDNDSSPPTSLSPTEMETDANSGTSTPPRYETVNAPTLRARRIQIKGNMLKILEELKGRSDAAEFINFVSEKRAEDYYSVIDYPMCLNEIRDRINRHQCDSKTKFCDEFNAIIENCELYNGPDSVYTAQAKTLKARFDELVDQHVPDDSGLPIEHGLPSSSKEVTSTIEESRIKERSSKDKVTIEDLMGLRHAKDRIHWKLPIIKHASFKWKDIAKLIGCGTPMMKDLEEQCKDQEDCLQQALIENFIQCQPKHYSQDWSGLAELLNDVGLTRLAKSILAVYNN